MYERGLLIIPFHNFFKLVFPVFADELYFVKLLKRQLFEVLFRLALHIHQGEFKSSFSFIHEYDILPADPTKMYF